MTHEKLTYCAGNGVGRCLLMALGTECQCSGVPESLSACGVQGHTPANTFQRMVEENRGVAHFCTR